MFNRSLLIPRFKYYRVKLESLGVEIFHNESNLLKFDEEPTLGTPLTTRDPSGRRSRRPWFPKGSPGFRKAWKEGFIKDELHTKKATYVEKYKCLTIE